ncbi:hypothetical protein BCR41DRAFT_361101 [Lobosporangium transversale]|uniref:Uncharacterized protein n=1 Tax=Lobosporangium transversale TaxID=64571 RepID=A0A1Y2GDW9_9FUNG|nr:hypothetical protein BCR41DRAFT_361101 [Lobosporangium transversale]ORZ06339.1 hypothetical protein BCR41DRAFT_361101 [Lobosporangium transversale]|eukprot:XP_021877502.1 hypothetical protein BCR41DRAFT_361101 [Lobosporangium transversale]
MSKKLTAQALDLLLSNRSTNSSNSNSNNSKSNSLVALSKKDSAVKPSVSKKRKKLKSKSDSLPKTKTGLKKIKHELRYGYSIRKALEEKEAKENPLDKLRERLNDEQVILQDNLTYYRTTKRASKKEIELAQKVIGMCHITYAEMNVVSAKKKEREFMLETISNLIDQRATCQNHERHQDNSSEEGRV